MLYFIGTGLTPDSLSLRALKIIKSCDTIFLDAYTSILVSFEQMKELLEETLENREIQQADRKLIETEEYKILDPARDRNVALLVVGDAMCATTHSDLYLRAVKQGIQVKVIPNASIINSIAASGVEIYKVGRTISVPFFDENIRPASFVDKIVQNYNMGLHSLMLMDIKTKEMNIKAYIKGVERYDPPRYMLSNLCAKQIVEVLNEKKFESKFNIDSLAVALMRVGTDAEKYLCAPIKTMAMLPDEIMGEPLHSVLVLGNDISDMEAQMFNLFAYDDETKQILKNFMLD
ncbi:Diphthine synthase [Spironucleus salmonicida]|uniref:diphthine methyl ester synthase n=1 Tax=Spironucleus salmonicida TaxID=348837 RepID=V6LUQ3_9EUKA|nr:Diphthine synthase [Spironucleus salmonicida]|eukprot:EST47436.1 Diphthine synthase [Spironucleus salmonicida]